MSHARALLIGALASLFFASAASAEKSRPTIACPSENTWRHLSKADIAELGLTELIATFSRGLEAVLPGSPLLHVHVIATDCPKDGQSVTASWQTLKIDGSNGEDAYTTTYVIYPSASYMRGWGEGFLLHEAWKIGCNIRGREAHRVGLTPGVPDFRIIQQCVFEAALAAGEQDYAAWLERTIPDLSVEQAVLAAGGAVKRAIEHMRLQMAPSGAEGH